MFSRIKVTNNKITESLLNFKSLEHINNKRPTRLFEPGEKQSKNAHKKFYKPLTNQEFKKGM
jgi:hypothetical protein